MHNPVRGRAGWQGKATQHNSANPCHATWHAGIAKEKGKEKKASNQSEANSYPLEARQNKNGHIKRNNSTDFDFSLLLYHKLRENAKGEQRETCKPRITQTGARARSRSLCAERQKNASKCAGKPVSYGTQRERRRRRRHHRRRRRDLESLARFFSGRDRECARALNVGSLLPPSCHPLLDLCVFALLPPSCTLRCVLCAGHLPVPKVRVFAFVVLAAVTIIWIRGGCGDGGRGGLKTGSVCKKTQKNRQEVENTVKKTRNKLRPRDTLYTTYNRMAKGPKGGDGWE